MEAFIIDQLPKTVPFVEHVGVTLTQANAEGGAGSLEQRPEIENHIQSVHAGALFTLAETTAGAELTALVFDRLPSLTIVVSNAEISFTKKARGKISATSEISATRLEMDRALDTTGSVTFGGKVKLANEDGDTVAEVTFSFHARDRNFAEKLVG